MRTLEQLHNELALLERIEDAIEQYDSPYRDRVVIRLPYATGDEYVATHRWEINRDNGYVTVQLRDGSILPTRPENWCMASIAEDHFGIERRQIVIDDPR